MIATRRTTALFRRLELARGRGDDYTMVLFWQVLRCLVVLERAGHFSVWRQAARAAAVRPSRPVGRRTRQRRRCRTPGSAHHR